MTAAEAKLEFDYRYAERLGHLCGASEPTREQIDLAFKEASEAVETLKREDKPSK